MGLAPEAILDFSVSTNPYGPYVDTAEIISQVCFNRYPDSDSSGLRQLLSTRLNVLPDNIVVGNGSTDLIRLVTLAYLGTGDCVLIPQPTYGEYEMACNLVDAHILKIILSEKSNFEINIEKITNAIKNKHPRAVFICNPNNPTGQYLSAQDFEAILSAAGECLIVLDEAYAGFIKDRWISTDLIDDHNLIIIRSMTKDYALAGLRLGYLAASRTVASTIRKIQEPWSVNAVAQVTGIQALKLSDNLSRDLEKIVAAKDYLIEELNKLGILCLPSDSPFFLAKVKSASKIREALTRKGILVRDCTSFSLSNYIRLFSRPIPDCQRLIQALKEIGSGKNDS
jgi:histidinol-phosphate aminotransferase